MESIVVKGVGDGLAMILPQDGDFEQVAEDLHKKLSSVEKFFEEAPVTLFVGNRQLSSRQRGELKSIVEERFNFSLAGIESVFEKTRDRGDIAHGGPSLEVDDLLNRRCDAVRTLRVKKTLRSGQRVKHRNTVLVLGDVNPGAEVVAGGDVYVMGKLEGVAHAGAFGSNAAVIVAFSLQPLQLRIGEHVSRSPDEASGLSGNRGPEMARVEDGRIVIETFSPRLWRRS